MSIVSASLSLVWLVPVWSLCLGSAQAQGQTYDQHMQQGYDALIAQDYRGALQQFTAALQQQPDDPYARTAIRNIEIYLSQSATDSASLTATVLPVLPLDLGAPGNRTSAGIRSRCSALETVHGQRLTALTPRSTLGVTLSSHPTFLFYVPQTVAEQAEFALSDAQDQVIYYQTFPLSQAPGIINVRIPTDVAPLQTGEMYRWGLELVCDLEDPAKNAVVIGNVQRIALPGLGEGLPTPVEPQTLLTLQQIQGVWFDVVAGLAEQRRSDRGNSALEETWRAILAAEDLEGIAQAPLLLCCQP